MRERVDRWAPTSGEARRVRVDASVREDAGELVLELRIDDGSRTESRRVRSRDCEALARATGLVIAVAIDPLGVAQTLRVPDAAVPGPTIAPAPVVVPVPVRQPAPVREPAPPIEPPERPEDPTTRSGVPLSRPSDHDASPRSKLPVRLGLRPELLVGGGLLPGVIGLGVAGTLAVFGRARPWRAELGGAYWFPRRATVADAPEAGGEIWLAHARGSGCGVPTLRRLEFPICAGIDVGAVGGTGFGEGVDAQTNQDVFVALHGGVGLAWAPIPALALFARVEGVAALRRPGFELQGVGDVHRVGAAGARGAFGLEVRFFR